MTGRPPAPERAPAARPGLLRDLGVQVQADLRGALRVLSPRSTARLLVLVVWVLTVPRVVSDSLDGITAGEPARLVIGLGTMAATSPLLFLPSRYLAYVYLPLAGVSPFVVLASMMARDDMATRAADVITLSMVPVFAFMLWGRRLGLLTTLSSLTTVAASAALGLLPAPVVIASAMVLASCGLILGWSAYAAERLENDAVTGLPNRRALDRRLAKELARGREPGGLALAVLDVDGVEQLNADRGRPVVDELLHQLGGLLASRLPDAASLFHLGAGEFALVVEGRGAAGPDLLESVRRSPWPGVTLSAGLALWEPTDTVSRLVTRAEASLARAKAGGPDRIDPHLVDDDVVRVLAESLAEGAFTVLFQPIVDLATGATVGAEALVRWEHPTRGRVAPDEFVGTAEQTGLIHDLGRLVMRTAFRSVLEAEAAGRRMDRLGVNVSALELLRPGFGDDLLATLADTGFEPTRLVLEITESAVVGDSEEQVVRTLSRLRAHGVRVAVDDFGTGYSSLGRLGRLPVDFLKVDKSFVWTDDPEVRDPLLTAIIRLADSFGLTTVAEGIETWDQAELLRSLGCTLGQGYLFGRPAELSELDLPPLVVPRGPRPDVGPAEGPDEGPDGGAGGGPAGPSGAVSPAGPAPDVPAARRPGRRGSSAWAP